MMIRHILDVLNGTLVLQLVDTDGRCYQHSYYGQAAQLASDVRAALVDPLDLGTWDGNEIDEGWEWPGPYVRPYRLDDLLTMSDDDLERNGSAALRDLVLALRA